MDVAKRFIANRSKGLSNGCVSLLGGIPGKDTLIPCQHILQTATSHLLADGMNVSRTCSYGSQQGDEEFRNELAKFLTQQYGDPVNSENLILSAGATNGIHLLATILFGPGTTCFMEDPTYFIMQQAIRKDLHMNIIPVKLDSEGMDVVELDKLLTQHKPSKLPPNQPYWSVIYTIPVYHNPTGMSYSPARCHALVECARKHKVLIIAEDVYNLINFSSPHPPKRLIAYDNPLDADYYGNVVSNGTFSKILMPAIRLGWIESPQVITNIFCNSSLMFSGGSVNHYGSLVVNSMLKLNLLQPHLDYLKQTYGKRMKIICEALKKIPDIKFAPSEGGFFLWIELPAHINSSDLLSQAVDSYDVMFIPGECTSPSGGFSNYIRLSVSMEPEDRILKGIGAFVQLLQKTLTEQHLK